MQSTDATTDVPQRQRNPRTAPQIFQALKSSGFDGLSGGTLYPALNRLEKDGLVSSQWREGEGDAGPGKKFYALTRDGHERLREGAPDWADFAAVIEKLLRERRG